MISWGEKSGFYHLNIVHTRNSHRNPTSMSRSWWGKKSGFYHPNIVHTRNSHQNPTSVVIVVVGGV
ncbi:MAG: hypothetical protein HC836_32250 [Richelia sp. RM2_1_2]|nr:hypothetical protein [Richelia sp. RM2_1_2]